MFDSAILRQALLSLHLIGLALGLGGAAVADFMFFKAVKMGDRITPETVSRMRSISNVVWVGIGTLTFSGICLFALHPSIYLASSGFLAKMVVVAILVVNGLFLNFYTTARLTTFNFSEKYTKRDAAWRARKLSFIFGAVSTVSWYSALLIAQFKGVINLSFYEYILIYILALAFAITTSLILEYRLHTKLGNAPMTIDRLTPGTPTPNIPKTVPTQPLTPPSPVVTAPPNTSPPLIVTPPPASVVNPAPPSQQVTVVQAQPTGEKQG